MKLFTCAACQQTLFFENSRCTRCGHPLAYLPELNMLAAMEPVDGVAGLFVALGSGEKGARYRLCGNQIDHAACNWAVRETEDQRFCRSCRLNDIIPNLSDPKAKEAWVKLEQSKRRLIYTLLELGLPVESRVERPELGLAFALKQDLPGEEKVFIGHDRGLITINIAEADSPLREKTAARAGRDVPDAARPLAPRDRPLLLGPAGRDGRRPRRLPRALRRRARRLRARRCQRSLRRRRARGLAGSAS